MPKDTIGSGTAAEQMTNFLEMFKEHLTNFVNQEVAEGATAKKGEDAASAFIKAYENAHPEVIETPDQTKRMVTAKFSNFDRYFGGLFVKGGTVGDTRVPAKTPTQLSELKGNLLRAELSNIDTLMENVTAGKLSGIAELAGGRKFGAPAASTEPAAKTPTAAEAKPPAPEISKLKQDTVTKPPVGTTERLDKAIQKAKTAAAAPTEPSVEAPSTVEATATTPTDPPKPQPAEAAAPPATETPNPKPEPAATKAAATEPPKTNLPAAIKNAEQAAPETPSPTKGRSFTDRLFRNPEGKISGMKVGGVVLGGVVATAALSEMLGRGGQTTEQAIGR